MSKEEKLELSRFTTLVNPTLLSNVKLVSYFTNKKLYEVINDSLELYVEDFEIKFNLLDDLSMDEYASKVKLFNSMQKFNLNKYL